MLVRIQPNPSITLPITNSTRRICSHVTDNNDPTPHAPGRDVGSEARSVIGLFYGRLEVSVMSDKEFDCPQCGDSTETLHEGYCEQCCTENQAALDQHNFRHDYWASLSDAGKDAEIKRASRSQP